MRIRIVDAFTDRPFAGNPAGVLLLDTDTFPEDRWLQQLAAEVGLPETAFAHRLAEHPDADWALRWFTPTTEVNMCGHATLATAHVLHSTGAAAGTIRFTTRSGTLRAVGADDGTITLDFPTAPLRAITPPAEISAAIGADVLSVHETGPDAGEPLVEVADEQTVRRLAPDLASVAALPWRGGLIVTARAENPAAEYDFVSRCFFPGIGIDEDPVTGGAHTALAPFWSARLGTTTLTGLQASARSGLVRTELRGERTLLRGSAVTVIDGELLTTP
ncbi:PhzF family phenazine biosynthesis protein [Streptomyces sp. HUAS TT20]|uniref:PhzF family phenazine biosynthesis protein n=1 Tax=Streptomyces sp. HUAS TT20 TaxID=3447509 RepID=UPI0021DA89C9|nr:PhzF family phenazine biosynthesis protein [Streptomyces sp. HUAS 15-9]UXY32342.1 PhzF family phenazine biosynthesis protein [Streptomyces sp. HUAS 15-9]